MKTNECLIFALLLIVLGGLTSGFQGIRRTWRNEKSFLHQARQKGESLDAGEVSVMVNGMPGPMALEVAKVCLDRNVKLVPFGFTGSKTEQSHILVEGASNTLNVQLLKGLGSSLAATIRLKDIRKANPNLIIVDFTHPSAVLGNVQAYVEANCDFVMGTTGFNSAEVSKVFDFGSNYAVIAPNMAKQIVALQAAIQQTSERFPGAFKGYTLSVTESHQSTKADTSGTAKAIISHLSVLNSEPFPVEDVVKIREKSAQLNFGVPEDALSGHAFHTYQFKSADKSVTFELQHNVLGRRVYAEGTVDGVEYLHSIRRKKPKKRLYNMIDVLEANKMK